MWPGETSQNPRVSHHAPTQGGIDGGGLWVSFLLVGMVIAPVAELPASSELCPGLALVRVAPGALVLSFADRALGEGGEELSHGLDLGCLRVNDCLGEGCGVRVQAVVDFFLSHRDGSFVVLDHLLEEQA